MDLRISPSSGVPVYVQLMEQIKHAVDVGAIRAGEQLPTIRKVAEELAMNPNTVARAYRELEHQGIIEVLHGTGAFVAEPRTSSTRMAKIRRTGEYLRHAIEKGATLGLSEEELRRAFEDELSRLQANATPARGRT